MIENLTDKQFDMGRYMSDPTKEEKISVKTVLGSKKTKCGTVGCILGWSLALIPEIRKYANKCIDEEEKRIGHSYNWDWMDISNYVFEDGGEDDCFFYNALFDAGYKSDRKMSIERIDYMLENGIPTSEIYGELPVVFKKYLR